MTVTRLTMLALLGLSTLVGATLMSGPAGAWGYDYCEIAPLLCEDADVCVPGEKELCE